MLKLAVFFALQGAGLGLVVQLLPLWFALVQQNGGNRRVALRVIQEG